MGRVTRLITVAALVAVATMASGTAQGPGRTNANWPTIGADAQRTSWMKNELKLSATAMATPGFQLLWKTKLDNQPRQLNGLTQPLLLQNIISHKGFKALAFVGGSDDIVYAIDYDLNKVYWTQRLNTAVRAANASVTCPGGLTALTRAATLIAPGLPGTPGAAPAPVGRAPVQLPPAPNRGAINASNLPINNAVYAVSSGGLLHVLNPHIGEDIQPAVKFLAPNAKVAGLILIDNMLYAATADNCGGVANGIYALDLGSEAKTITKWESTGGSIAGTMGPTFGVDGTVYAATGGDARAGGFANSVVALEPGTLTLRDHFTADSPFTTAPVAFRVRDRDLLAVGNGDGRIYLLDARTLGGTDHRTPLATSDQYAGAPDHARGALASWEDAQGTRWVLATSAKGVVAFRIGGANGVLSLDRVWTSRDIEWPLPPTILNDVVFAVASGLPPGAANETAAERVKRSGRAVLYALDARSGKDLWNSGDAITSFAPGVAPSAGDGQVYVVTYDGTVYAFGLPQER
jgi:outer membrane protein assembly factor BamB